LSSLQGKKMRINHRDENSSNRNRNCGLQTNLFKNVL
jgi:hypothetical protein